jgi:hypothetical protein
LVFVLALVLVLTGLLVSTLVLGVVLPLSAIVNRVLAEERQSGSGREEGLCGLRLLGLQRDRSDYTCLKGRFWEYDAGRGRCRRVGDLQHSRWE